MAHTHTRDCSKNEERKDTGKARKQTKTMKNEELQKQENKNMKRICGWGKGKVRAERRTILRMFFKKKNTRRRKFLVML